MTIANLVRYAALLGSMIISATTQYGLAVAHGIPEYAALTVPMAIDCYLIWAVRTRRDIVLAVLVSVATNIAGVLTAEELSAVGTWVGAVLHAVFPVLVWRMHRTPADSDRTPVEVPQEVIPEPQAEPMEPDTSADAAGPETPVQSLTDSWPDDDLWADFEATEPADSAATPPSPEDVRAVIAELGGQATGQQLARHYGVSDRTGRRYLKLATEQPQASGTTEVA